MVREMRMNVMCKARLTFYENVDWDECSWITGMMRKKPFMMATYCPIKAMGRSIFYSARRRIFVLSNLSLRRYNNHNTI